MPKLVELLTHTHTSIGTTYIQVTDPALVVPAIAVACSASGLFVFPAMEVYMTSAIELYNYEKANAVGKAQDLILQGFIRYVTVAFFPVVVSISLIYLLVCGCPIELS